ncbi:MAG: indolepyruvate ferredoxin oxidoreductase family protein [Proteobacteria bacterium]|nr:indolepyruvate ferredoxin oxidoreductase family protein [Pseudomonadota bacterium]
MVLANVKLDDKYRLQQGRVFLSGVQALTRLPLLQRQRDLAAGLNTAGYVSGYRGSPLGGLDSSLEAAASFLRDGQISFHPGVNEDLAATAIWGTQQLHLFPQPKYDGVFAMWYGKGPGVDRCGDVFKHANYAGTAKHGGVLLVAGDDHSARSSAIAHQSEHSFSACGIPVLAPAGLQEYLDLGLHGWAMSRYSGCWVAMKVTSTSAESSATVDIDAQRVNICLPEDFILPPDGVHSRWPDPPLAQELRMQQFKVYAALAYARANRLNHLVFGATPAAKPARLGIIACGKAYLDVRQALDDLGIDENAAAAIGLRLFKVGMPWPLEATGVRQFAEGLEEILVVEEKRPIIEYQLREQLYNWRENVRPRVLGKFAEADEWALPASSGSDGLQRHWQLPPTGELTPAIVARAIAARLSRFHDSPSIQRRMAAIDERQRALARSSPSLLRTPYFCSGCPHNLSTKVPQGSSALGGVGCHLMVLGMERNTLTICQMGGEGATWLGLAAHTGTQHVFANMGDGTYYHSGLLAIRAAVAADVNITYKILYNDAVAMTGGQAHDGPLDVPQITRQLAAEGLRRIVVLADDPDKYPQVANFAPGVEIRRREELETTQRELRATPGVTALIYDQTCAAEKRRRRKRGSYPDPAQRVFINPMVCEGCGDCSAKSNCLSVVPVDTEFGSKRAIDQSSCNKDYSCLAGFCPSLVSIEGGTVRKGRAVAVPDADAQFALGEPQLPALDRPYGILIAGVGGTGVVTIGALIGMAAHLEGKGVTVLDMTGLAQKGGAVLSHVRVAREQGQLHAVHIDSGEADCLLGCDIVVAVGNDALDKTRAGFSRAIVNRAQTITGEFVRHPDLEFPLAAMEQQVRDAVGTAAADFLDATDLAWRLMGDSIMSNLFMLGYAWQKGLVPVSAEALLRAIELNGVAVEKNTQAFIWGRRAAVHPERIAALTGAMPVSPPRLEARIATRRAYLQAYQNVAYAARYAALVERAGRVERQVMPGSSQLVESVTNNYFRLLAYKDEYEVARLYSAAEFDASVNASFEGDFRIYFHFNMPMVGAVDRNTGEPRKYRFGSWMRPLLGLLARLKFLRGTPFDAFGYAEERRLERQLIAEYEVEIAALLQNLRPDNYAAATALAAYPDGIRGFGPVKMRSVLAARAARETLRAVWRGVTGA